jgi:hypothetical protein
MIGRAGASDITQATRQLLLTSRREPDSDGIVAKLAGIQADRGLWELFG